MSNHNNAAMSLQRKQTASIRTPSIGILPKDVRLSAKVVIAEEPKQRQPSADTSLPYGMDISK